MGSKGVESVLLEAPMMKLAPYNPTHHEGVVIALELLELSSEDVLMDIGCGDGRLLTQVHRL